jgi:hypothetical protein
MGLFLGASDILGGSDRPSLSGIGSRIGGR